MKAVTHLEKVIAGETSAVTHLEKVIAQEATAVTYTEKVIVGEAPPVTHLQKVIAGEARPVTHLEYVWAGGSPPSVQEYTGAVPVAFAAYGTPLLDYIISGNAVQDGTPTPDNPIMPQGTGERTENLAQWEKGGINTSAGANEAYKTKEQGGTCEQLRTQYIPCIGDSTYVLSVNKYPVQSFISFYDENKNYLSRTPGYQQSGTRSFRADINAKYMRAQLAHVLEDHVYPAIEENAQFAITLGSTPLPYEPYGYKIPISSASTTTPVYLGEVETTRNIRKIVFVGSEDEGWSAQSAGGGTSRFRCTISNSVQADTAHVTSICTHLPLGVEGSTWNTDNIYTISNNYLLVRFDSSFTTTASLKSWLAQQYANGTPFTVYYTLAEPTTGIVNEPLMRIGSYADTLSMEQAGVQIPTANGSTTLDVETTVKPSEVYIKYRGEAVATLSTLSAEVSSPEATPENANPEETEEEENGSEDISLQHEFEAIE